MADVFRIGDQVTDDTVTGTVVCLIDEGEFTSDYSASEWGYLKTGVLIITEEAGLVHFPDKGSLRKVE
jgi:hypothetical protein